MASLWGHGSNSSTAGLLHPACLAHAHALCCCCCCSPPPLDSSVPQLTWRGRARPCPSTPPLCRLPAQQRQGERAWQGQPTVQCVCPLLQAQCWKSHNSVACALPATQSLPPAAMCTASGSLFGTGWRRRAPPAWPADPAPHLKQTDRRRGDAAEWGEGQLQLL